MKMSGLESDWVICIYENGHTSKRISLQWCYVPYKSIVVIDLGQWNDDSCNLVLTSTNVLHANLVSILHVNHE